MSALLIRAATAIFNRLNGRVPATIMTGKALHAAPSRKRFSDSTYLTNGKPWWPSLSCIQIAHVFCLRSNFKMGRIGATSVVAFMHDNCVACQVKTKIEMSRYAVAAITSLISANLRITMASYATTPIPASIFSDADIAQKAALQ